jgi:hypothetical protein
MKPLDEELQEAAEELKKKQKEDLKQLKHLDLSSFQVPAKILYISRTGRVARFCLVQHTQTEKNYRMDIKFTK